MSVLSLNESEYNESIFTSHKECAFCMESFELGQKIIALPCDVRHFFHSKCILVWSRSQKNCPLCKLEFTESLIRKFQPQFAKIISK